jgi:bifunctional non-homologous end joining protein LigD
VSTRRFGPYSVEVSREEKILFPQDEISKGELMDYYQSVSATMLPHVKNRALTLQRFPDGIREDGFFQKTLPEYFPDWIGRVRIPLEKGEEQTQVVAANTATLVYLANQAAITPHVWLSRTDDLRVPDRMIFDLDPSGEDFAPVRDGALALKDLLEQVGLHPFFMTTGGSGGHVWTPLQRDWEFDAVREFAGRVAHALALKRPRSFTVEVRKEKRKGRLYLDVSRNAFGQTVVAPYAVRPYPGAPVATPLEWEELEKKNTSARMHHLRSVPRRLAQKEDPWKNMGARARSLSRAVERWEREMDSQS